MDLSISLGLGGWLVVIAGAVLFGLIAQFVGRAETDYEWLLAGVAAFVGAIVASEFVVDWRAYAPVYDGLALIPALLGGLVLGVILAVGTRLLTGGTYLGPETPA